MELYLPLNANKSRLNRIIKCLVDIKNWMAQNFLQLNEDKTEIFCFGSANSFVSFSDQLGNLSTYVNP